MSRYDEICRAWSDKYKTGYERMDLVWSFIETLIQEMYASLQVPFDVRFLKWKEAPALHPAEQYLQKDEEGFFHVRIAFPLSVGTEMPLAHIEVVLAVRPDGDHFRIRLPSEEAEVILSRENSREWTKFFDLFYRSIMNHLSGDDTEVIIGFQP